MAGIVNFSAGIIIHERPDLVKFLWEIEGGLYAYSCRICALEFFLLLLGWKPIKHSSRQIIFIPVSFLRGFDGGRLVFNFQIFSDTSRMWGLVMSGKSVFWEHGNWSLQLREEILQEPESCEDQLKQWDMKYFKTFWRFIFLAILTVGSKK